MQSEEHIILIIHLPITRHQYIGTRHQIILEKMANHSLMITRTLMKYMIRIIIAKGKLKQKGQKGEKTLTNDVGRSMKRIFFKIALIIFILIQLMFATCPLVAGDGMPAITYGEGEAEKIFSSIFESRQLAAIELLDSENQRISLFLSVYSLDPGQNLTIMVPLRTLPLNVTGQPMEEKEFRKEYKIEKAEKEIVRQDIDKANEKLVQETGKYFEYAFGSFIWTLPAEFTRQEIHQIESGGGLYEEDKASSGADSYGEPEPIQHYEFDGFSIDVFGVSAGPKLVEYLADKGLVLPNTSALDKYNDQYIAVIESETKPPITEYDFDRLQNSAPSSLGRLVDELKRDPKRDYYEVNRLKRDLDDHIYEEVDPDYNDNYDEYRDLRNHMDDLVDAVFGEANFDGEVLRIDLPLDDGRMFFPLGTSAGWENQVGDIDILFKVPENKALSLTDAKDAYFDGAHFYLVQMENANPDFDLESSIDSADTDRKSQMEQAAFITDNSMEIALLFIFIILIVLWLIFVLCLRLIRKKKEPVKNYLTLLLLIGLSLVISVPGTLLLFLLIKPVPLKKITQEFIPTALLIFWPLSIILFIVGVMS